MDRFEDIVNLKLDHIIEKHDEAMAKLEDHEQRLRVLERFKYKMMAAGTGLAAGLGVAGHKIGEWLGFTQQ